MTSDSQFDRCTETCGWVAAFIAALAYGTFGVPIKETVKIDVHPLILQSYKTFTMFVMSWGVILMGEKIRFTPWGILSGLLWVLGGTGGIYGIRNAGMSVAVGTWSSCMVVINFLVGIIVFREPVASVSSTFAAFFLLGLGLVGMSIYSAPSASASASSTDSNNPLMGTEQTPEENMEPIVTVEQQNPTEQSIPTDDDPATARARHLRSRSSENLEVATDDYDPLRDPTGSTEPYDPSESHGLWRGDRSKPEHIRSGMNNHFGLTRRQLGILGAVINGVLTGSSLIPIHYAKRQGFGGATYMLSFATGALLSNLLIWALWFFGKLIQSGSSMPQTYESMPPCYFKQLWAPGFSAGVLLAIAMFGSIMSVTYLGQGVGNSIMQSKIFISGLWGIGWYKEVSGGITIAKWFLSASLTISGIMWLSYERIHAQAADGHHF